MKASLSFIVLAFISATYALQATVFYKGTQGYSIQLDTFDLEHGAAAAIYNPTLFSIGFDSLHITSNVRVDDAVQAYAAGYLEGYVTAQRIWDHWNNMRAYTFSKTGGSMPPHVRTFLQKQLEWIEDQVKASPRDPYWMQVNTVYQQYMGLVAGYNVVAAPKNQSIDAILMQTISSFGDLFEIMSSNDDYAPRFNKMNLQQLLSYFERHTHCSALIKVTPDLSDMYFGHTSWFTYSAMIRIHKEYNFNFNNPLVKAKQVVFSSYPGTLASNDDFYMNNKGLAVIETSIVLFNESLHKLIQPQSLLCWQRAILANRMADTSPEWARIFSIHNSGTYNNQFMALDLKRFQPKNKLLSDALWIVEQMPGMIASGDVTNILGFGYWPSYNVPYFETIREYSGLNQYLQKFPESGVMMSYDHCVRANIFRRDQGTVNSTQDYKRIIRYNNYKYDPLSLGNPGYSISSRNDLRETGASCGGAYDAKVTSWNTIQEAGKLVMEVINGPTYDQQPAFVFGNQCEARVAHQGMPKAWKFPWTTFSTATKGSSPIVSTK